MMLILFISFSWYVHGFGAGKPVVTDEYLVRFNRLGHSEMPASENAWPRYERAFAALVEPTEELEQRFAFRNDKPSQFPGFAAISDEERKAISEWVAANDAAWARFVEATNCPYCYRQLNYDPNVSTAPLLISITMNPSLPQLRYLTKVGIWRARLAAEKGQLGAAIKDCLAVVRAGRHFQESPTLIDQLVGVSCGALGRSELLRIVSEHHLPASTLRGMQTTLAELFAKGPPLMNFAGERLVILDVVQHTFTQGGFGGGHLIPGQFDGVFLSEALPKGARPTVWTQMVFRALDVGYSMIHARRNKTVAKIHALYDEIDARGRLTPYQHHMRGERDITRSIDSCRYGYVRMLLPAERRVSEIGFRFRADHEALLTVLALHRYRAETGAYPDDLKCLVEAGYLQEVPMDPFSDHSLVYRPVGDGFLLYSVGPDFVDDGGKRGVDDKGQAKAWADNGDRVFWPLRGALE